MIREIVKDPIQLSLKSTEATKSDLSIALDLMDTLRAHQAGCVGMAANMIGYAKRIIIVNTGLLVLVMINPKITQKKNPYQVEEGCLSLPGKRPTKRYEEIVVTYEDMNFVKHSQKYTGYVAEIIQHECDHLEGIII